MKHRTNVNFSLPHALDVFPAPHQLMEVFSSQLLGVFSQEIKQLKRSFELRLAGGELRAAENRPGDDD